VYTNVNCDLQMCKSVCKEVSDCVIGGG